MKVLKFALVRGTDEAQASLELEMLQTANALERRGPDDWAEYREAEKEALMLELQAQARSVFAARELSISGFTAAVAVAHRRPQLSVIKGGKRD